MSDYLSRLFKFPRSDQGGTEGVLFKLSFIFTAELNASLPETKCQSNLVHKLPVGNKFVNLR
jgi:hypothetical protein